MTPTSTERVIVGVDGSSASIVALRTAAEQARRRHARLCVIHVSELGVSATQPAGHGRADGRGIVDAALEDALGGDPSDLIVSRLVAFGRPGPSLVASAWRENDVLVLGSRGRHRWHRLLRRSVSHYCATHAHGPVLVVHHDDTITPSKGQRPDPE
jgi:nucleotide-binding universal stress UspA family protein